MTAAAPSYASRKRADVVALFFVALLTVLSLAVGLHTGDAVRDVDEVVYENTLVSMQHGQGYYPAMRAALVEKDGAAPSQIRSIRPPTLFLLLYKVPRSAWRWVVGLVFAATLLFAWRVGRASSPIGGPLAVALAGAWLIGSSPYMYLHSELWGLPLLFAAVLAMRNLRWAVAAACLAAACLFREIYVVAFLAGLVCAKERRWFWAGLGGLSAAGGLHALLATQQLGAIGKEASFGQSGLSLHYIREAVSPGDNPVAWVLGIVGGALGLVALAHLSRKDRGARMLLGYVSVMYPATILIGRSYWSIAFGAAVAAYAPAAGVPIAAATRRVAAGLTPRRVRATSS